MRVVTMLFGLILLVLAGLWFFTPVLDTTYTRHVPGLAHSRGHQAGPAAGTATRGAAPTAPAASSSGAITSKALSDNLMSMINLATGALGAFFTFMSYMQARGGRRRADD